MPRFVVPAADIDIAGIPVDEPLPTSWLAEQLADTDVGVASPGEPTAGHVRVRLSRSGNEIVVRGRVEARLSVPCARCLEPAALAVDGPVSLVLRPERVAHGHATHTHGAHGAHGGPRKGKAGKAGASVEPADAARAPRRNAAGAAGAAGSARGERGRAGSQEYEFSSEEADLDTFDGETVVLDELLREAVLLEIPIFPLCSDDCAGIAPGLASRGPSADASGAAGAREERRLERPDPRLAPLAALRRRLGSGPAEAGPAGLGAPGPGPAASGGPKRPQLSASGLRPKKPKKKKS